MENGLQEITALLDAITAFVGFNTNEGFYRKCIRLLGIGLVWEALGQVKARCLMPGYEPILDKAKYLTDTLVRWMTERGLYPSPCTDDDRALAQNTFCLVEAAKHESTVNQKDEITTLDYPFSPGLIQWLFFVGPEYFTLTNEKAKSDRVDSTKLDLNGQTFDVPMLRGRLGRNGTERGILTAEHMRILGAIERIWANKIGPHEKNSRRCVVRTNVPEIAHYLCLSPGGREYKRISDKIQDLASTGYTYLLSENPALKAMGLEDINFKFFGEAQTITTNFQGKKTTSFEITFTRIFSAALLARDKNLVSRPVDMLTIRGDIALKLYVYLYRILVAKEEHTIELRNLIKSLDLRLAGWHQYKSQRRREFETAIREINGRTTHDSRVFSLRIEQGLNDKDFLLVARLNNP